ncbi:MAG: DUF1926 domain-containing protein [Candidatus Omnitrophica bacterium]|nr:DUF1926 domain-containing protein [Candidatus Omnitrophota bacterium]
MGKVYFLFGIHNHQPVGNFDHVFEYAYKRCYFPLLETLANFPKIKFSVHISGPLYDWILKNRKEYVSLLKEMVTRGQVEIISGGYYEPILPLISDRDKKAQIQKMNDFISKEFNCTASGLWLAERVWEPNLPAIINPCGLDYTFLDDTHFRFAGINKNEFTGYYTTEDQAFGLKIFPISKALRYKIPFSSAQEGIDLLNSFASEEDVLVTFFDDGEKFGLWPNTYDWVYEKGWLKTFLTYLSDSLTIETIKPSEAALKFSSSGIVYLPTASYEEMGEWVLSADSFNTYDRLNNFLKNQNKFEEFKNFVRAGFFRNFNRKYPRLNYMHKRMLSVSKKLHAYLKNGDKAFTNLFKAQTNCSYWHGVFGGFYLGHIRGAVYENLICALNQLDKKIQKHDLVVEEEDIDLDGVKETIVKNKKMICCFSRKGGTLLECSLRNPAINLTNTITRTVESYHKKIKENVNVDASVASIHDIVVQKDKDLDKFLIYDNYEKVSLIDHRLDKDITIADFNTGNKITTFSDKNYNLLIKKSTKQASLKYKYDSQTISFTKEVILKGASSFAVEYSLNNYLENCDFGVEFNLFLPSLKDIVAVSEGKSSKSAGPKGVTIKKENKKISLNEPKVFDSCCSFVIIGNHKRISLEFGCEDACVFTMPLYSVSSSEAGFEKAYQQLSVLFKFSGERKKIHFTFKVKKGE